MQAIRFEEWAEVLARADLPQRQKRSWEITLRWYLSFCRRSRAGVTVQSAREFIEWAQAEKAPQPWQLDGWKEALNWFFREAKVAAGQKTEPPNNNPQNQTFNVQPSASKPTDKGDKPGRSGSLSKPLVPAWKTAFLTVVRRRHYSYRTEQSYLVWLERFARFCRAEDLSARGAEDIKAFLDELALKERLSVSSQRQALNAVVFLLREGYGKELGDFSDYQRARARTHVPSWLTANEVRLLLSQLEGRWTLLTCVAFGSGLRLMELLRLRVKDVDLKMKQVTVRAAA